MSKKNLILVSVGLVFLGIAGLIVAVKFLTDVAKVEKEKTVDNVTDVPFEEVKPNNVNATNNLV